MKSGLLCVGVLLLPVMGVCEHVQSAVLAQKFCSAIIKPWAGLLTTENEPSKLQYTIAMGALGVTVGSIWMLGRHLKRTSPDVARELWSWMTALTCGVVYTILETDFSAPNNLHVIAPFGVSALALCASLVSAPENDTLPIALPPQVEPYIGDIPEQVRTFMTSLTDLKIRAAYAKRGLPPARGFLLHGPSGVGKTALVRHLGKLLDIPVFTIQQQAQYGVFRGDALRGIEKTVKAAQQAAKKNRHKVAIVFVDECETVLPCRNQMNCDVYNAVHVHSATEVTNYFLQLLDGVRKPKSEEAVLVIGGTNHLHRVDPSIAREGRLTPIAFGYPSAAIIEQVMVARIRQYAIAEDSLKDRDIQVAMNLVGTARRIQTAVSAGKQITQAMVTHEVAEAFKRQAGYDKLMLDQIIAETLTRLETREVPLS